MTTDPVDSTPTSSETTPTTPPAARGGKAGVAILGLALLATIGGFGYAYWQLSQVNLNLANLTTQLSDQVKTQASALDGLKSSIGNVQEAQQKSSDLAVKQEAVMAEWQKASEGDLQQWRIAQAEYLVNLANDSLQFNQQIAPAITMLQRADALLAKTSGEGLTIRKPIAEAIARLDALPKLDVAATYLRINGLAAQIDQLPLPNTNAPLNVQPAPLAENLPWWRIGLIRTWEVLQKVVVVKNVGSNALPLVLPDEKVFLYQNLHAQLATASYALLHHQPAIYTTSLNQTIEWVKKYFVQTAPATVAMLQSLDELSKVDVAANTADLSDVLQQFATLKPSVTVNAAPAATNEPVAATTNEQVN